MVVALFALSGALAALAYAASLAWNARLYLSARATIGAVLLHGARTLAVVVVLVGLSLAGGRPFLAALLAFGCAHVAAVCAMRRLA